MSPSTTDPVVISVRGRPGVLAAIPGLLGFHPTDSLVVVCLRGRPRRAGPVLRIDLPGSEESAPDTIGTLLDQVGRHASEVLLIGYGHDAGPAPGIPPGIAPRVLLDRTARALRSGGIEVLDAFWAKPVLPDPDLAAALALQGRRVLPDRTALTASVRGPTGERADAAGAAFDRVADALIERLAREPWPGPGVRHEQAGRVAESALSEVVQTGTVRFDTAAAFALHVCEPAVRDALIGRALGERNLPWPAVLAALARSLRDRDAVPVLGMLAMAAFRHGDGALAGVALDRSLSVAPADRLSRLLAAAMAAGLTPDQLDGMGVTARPPTARPARYPGGAG